jgi:hypothetical protein
MTLPNFKLKIVAKDPTCADATAVLKDTANNTILTEAIPSGATENITAPDATVINSDNSYNQNARSNSTFLLPDTTYNIYVAGNLTPVTFDLPTLKNETINIVWQ